jgi:hypothetical protein
MEWATHDPVAGACDRPPHDRLNRAGAGSTGEDRQTVLDVAVIDNWRFTDCSQRPNGILSGCCVIVVDAFFSLPCSST